MTAFQVLIRMSRRAAMLAGVCALVWGVGTSYADARDLIPDRPSVEVNLDALRALEPAQYKSTAPAVPAINYTPPVEVPARAVPLENQPLAPPIQSQPAPALVPTPPPVAPPPAPAQEAPVLVEKVTPARPLAPLPLAKKPVEKPVPAPAPAKPAVAVHQLPAEQPIKPIPLPPVAPAVAPKSIAPATTNPNSWQNAPVPTVVPDSELPAVSGNAKKPSTADALQPRKGDIPALPPAVLPPLGKSRIEAPVPESATAPIVPPASEPSASLQLIREKPVSKRGASEKKSKPAAAPKSAEANAALEETAPVISTSPILVPVPAPPPELPPSVTKRLEKTFNTEPAQQGIVRDVKSVKNTLEESSKAKEAVKATASSKAVTPVPPGVTSAVEKPAVEAVNPPEPAKAARSETPPEAKTPAPAQAEKPQALAKPAERAANATAKAPVVLPPPLPLPPLGDKPAEAPSVLPVKTPEPVASAKPQAPSVLPLPMPELPVKAQAEKPLEKTSKKSVETPKAGAENLPPPELPPAGPSAASVPVKTQAEPIKLPKSEIASVPKLVASADTGKALPELPSPPKVAEPVKKEVAANLSVTTQPAVKGANTAPSPVPDAAKSASSNTLSAPPKLPLPSLSAITGDKPPSSVDVVAPKDAISAAPLSPGPKPTVVADATPPVLPAAKTPEKPAAAAASAPALPLPALPPIAAVQASAPGAKEVAPSAAKAESSPTPSSGKDKRVATIDYAKNRVDLSEESKTKLAAIAEDLKKSQGSVRVVASASGTPEEASVARRTAFSRGTEIRAFFINKGVNKLNVTVQVGPTASEGSEDRAEIFIK